MKIKGATYLYSILWIYVRVLLHVFFKKITVVGKEKIPNEAVIFTPNHQNAFLDAILIICSLRRATFSLARADIFKKPLANFILRQFLIKPVFRIRDGWQSLGENYQTFNETTQVLKNKYSIIIFPEGNHGEKRQIRPLSKGFTRLITETLKMDATIPIYVIPVGLNYESHATFRSKMSIYFGEPILANTFIENGAVGINSLRENVSDQLKKLTIHLEEPYEEKIEKLTLAGVDFTDPDLAHEILNRKTQTTSEKSNRYFYSPFAQFIFRLIHFPILLFWWKMERGIKDKVFVGSLKFGFGVLVFPLYYLFIAAVIYLLKIVF